MTEQRRQYTKRQKAVAVGLSVVDGVRSAARKTGIPLSTIESWRQNPAFAQLRTQKREEVALDVWAAFQEGVQRIRELIPVTEDMGKVAVATGIIYDKYALMSGQATARNEHRDLTADLDDHEKAALRLVLDDVLAKVEA